MSDISDIDLPLGHETLTHVRYPSGALIDISLHADTSSAAAHAHAPATHRAYAADAAHWSAWCSAHACDQLAALRDGATVAAYVTDQRRQGLAISTVRRRLSALSTVLRTADPAAVPVTRLPEVYAVLRAWSRATAADEAATGLPAASAPRQARALSLSDLRALVAACAADESPAGLRDRALILTGFAAALRRSELVGIDWSHLQHVSRGTRTGIDLILPRRKGHTDQTVILLQAVTANPELCPVTALQFWQTYLQTHDLLSQSPAVFRSMRAHAAGIAHPVDQVQTQRLGAHAVTRILRRRAVQAGLVAQGSQAWSQLSAHSLRRGLVTEASHLGIADSDLMQVTGHRSLRMVHTYRQAAERWSASVAHRVLSQVDLTDTVDLSQATG